ncbi:MAG TPA: hypothetical protein VGL81_26705 [Polyangiaceae bacterium]|jgi:hypothetical protein
MMSEGKTPPRSLDAMLAAWPGRERTAMEWDESAERVLSLVESGEKTRLAKASAHVSDEDLLRPPLPIAPGEVQSSAPIETRTEGTGMTTESRERDRAGFKDLARMANMAPPPSSVPPVRSAERSTPGEEKKDWETNSGVIDLGAISAKETPAEPAPKALVVAASAVAQSTMRSAGNEPKPIAVARDEKAAREEKKKSSPWVTIGGLVAAAAVAGGVFFGMRHTDVAAIPATVAVAPPPPAATAVVAQPVAAAAPATASPTPTEDRGVDPSSLPPASTGAVAAHGSSAVVVPAKPVAAAGPAPTTEPALVATVPTATAAPTGSASLQALMQQAAGVTSSPTATAATASPDEGLPAPGSVPLKPSQGAIQGSLGAALPSARACLGPDDPISHATITFKSDGSVQSVGVSGGAAGKPAEACIRTALTRARVAPFAQPTFTATATVRPN